MRIEPFSMERWQSTHEHHVDLNLSDSGAHPYTVRELLGDDPLILDALHDERLIYTQTNGTPELRQRIADLYPNTTVDDILVCNGGAEANFVAAWSLVEPGDQVVMMIPNYMQLWGLFRSLDAEVREWSLRPDFAGKRWVVDFDALEESVTPRTKLIAICNPNNPTGARLDAAELDRLGQIAARHGTWILSDEIYQGAELDGTETPTIRDRYDRTVITNSLSKSYGLPGLRLGWALGPEDLVLDLWSRHDYTTIGPSALSDRIATLVLSPGRRRSILDRSQTLLRNNYDVVASWLAAHGATLQHIPPEAGAMLYLKYDHDINSTELAQRLLDEKSLLLVPGDHFGMDRWLRIGFGGETDCVRRGLTRVAELLGSL